MSHRDTKRDDRTGLILPKSMMNKSHFHLLDCFEELTQLSNQLVHAEEGSSRKKNLADELNFKLEVFKHNLGQMDNFVRNCRCQTLLEAKVN